VFHLSRIFDAREPVDPDEAVRRAWERARDAGVYGFATDLVQTTYPALSLVNAGRGPQQDGMRLEGRIDMPARTMRMSMREGGAAASSRNGGEARIEGDRAYIRRVGDDWQEVSDFSATFAPDTDLLAYLSGMTNVREVPAEERRSRGAGGSRSTQHAARFTFRVRPGRPRLRELHDRPTPAPPERQR